MHRDDPDGLEDIDELRCIYCDEKWGNHYGPDCNYHNSGTQFQPKGILLSDICERCGKPFEEHLKRYYCNSGSTFKKKIIDTKLPEELFEI